MTATDPYDRRGLFILQADFDALEAKGVIDMIAERKEGDFLSKAITLHPMARFTRVIDAGPGLPVHELSLPQFDGPRIKRWLHFFFHLVKAVLYARRLANTERVSFVRAQDPYFAGLIGYLATRFSHIRFAISIHSDYEQRHFLDPDQGSPKIFGSRAIAVRLESFLLRRADLVMAIRESLREQAVRHGAIPSKTVVLPHPIDFDDFDKVEPAFPSIVEKFADGRKVILFAGRLSRENYVWDVVEAARRLADRDDCVFVLAGPGVELEAIREACMADMLLANMLLACGPLNRSVLHAAQKSAYVGVVLMGGFSLIEFCAASRACVTYDVEWHSELIENGNTGVLLREGDIDGLVAALHRLLDDATLVNRLGVRAYEKARRNHDVNTVRAIRIQAYNNLLRADARVAKK